MVTLRIQAAGLDAWKPDTFSAPDFDILCDCPVLIGSQEILGSEIQGIPHVIASEDLGDFNREKFTADIKKVCEGAISLFDHIFNRNENSANTTISYYDKGAALGLLLDLKIRHKTENRFSLDDVMRTLFRK